VIPPRSETPPPNESQWLGPPTDAAVVSADIENYSALAASMQWLVRFEQFLRAAGEHIRSGRDSTAHDVIKAAGDGILLVYPGGIAKALDHAWTLHQLFNLPNGEERQRQYGLWKLRARIAVHWGSVRLVRENPFTGMADAIGGEIVTGVRLEPQTIPGMVWATEAAAQRAAHESLLGEYFFRPIGEIELAKGWGHTTTHHLIRAGSRHPLPENLGHLSVKQYPHHLARDVYVLVIPLSAGEAVRSCHLAWGSSHYVYRSADTSLAGPLLFKHKLFSSPVPLPPLIVHTNPECWVEFPFIDDGEGAWDEWVENHAPLLPHEVAEELGRAPVLLDTEHEWYQLPNRP
jgi:class 3 adenylate cyclase